MEVAVSGDRSCVLSTQLAPRTYFFAVAHGFGLIDGEPPARIALQRLRGEFERRGRPERVRRAKARPKAIASLLIAALARVNGDLHVRSASHDDYTTAGCSLTAALVIDERAYLAHVGTSAAYLSRDGFTVCLTKEDAFDAGTRSVLVRAIGVQPHLEVSVCSFTLGNGDSLVLSGRRLGSADLERADFDEGLIVRYGPDEESSTARGGSPRAWLAFINGAVATAVFYAALCLG
ncbi:MAG: hypothetical protein M3R35_02745 [Candidatus Eremiobacteraeota bacterium]|nr:hypothetical protein [Candidatus Eremiobacteraeota bacterium]